jgi:predicted DsbA family dithiol-disulfide isomerase
VAEQSSLVRLQKQFDIALDWRGFELHPETPHGGVPVSRFFPSDQLAETQQYLQDFAARFGVTGMRVSGHVPNTRRALAVTEFSRDHGRLHEFREAAMSGFWREGLDLEADGDLAELARRAGLDPDSAVTASSDSEYLGHVDAIRQEAQRQGISAIPAFWFGDHPFPVVGCQPYERLAQVAREAGARRLRRA